MPEEPEEAHTLLNFDFDIDTRDEAAERSFFDSIATPWAEAGWPVIPVKPDKARATTAQPSSDPVRVTAWGSCRTLRHKNVGVVLNGTRTLVLDVDGHEGQKTLKALLTTAGVSLPDTYTETTGKPGGQHILLRLPPDVPSLRNQYANRYPDTPHLDVLFNGHFVAAGSIHLNSTVYEGDRPTPRWDDLAEVPGPLYNRLRTRGRVDATADPVGGSPRGTNTMKAGPEEANTSRTPGSAPGWVQALLNDTGDGKDARTLRVATGLVRLGWSDDQIVETVLAAPLGVKARTVQPRDPAAYVQHKIDYVRNSDLPPPFDQDNYWVAVHTSGLPSGPVRILDFMLMGSRRDGSVRSLSTRKIAMGAAMTDARDHLKALIAAGWLVVLAQADPTAGTARCYGLTVPNVTDGRHVGVPHPTGSSLPVPSYEGLSWWYLTTRSGHDAFRRATNSLNAAYPLLTLLRATPVSAEVLQGWLGTTHRTLKRMLANLLAAGLAEQDARGHRLSDGDITARLDQAADIAKTTGRRLDDHERYQNDLEAWEVERSEWLRDENRQNVKALAKRLRDLIPSVEGTPDAARVRALLADPEAMKASVTARYRPTVNLLPPEDAAGP